MKKNIFLTFIILLSISINAQNNKDIVTDSALGKKTYKPNKKEFTVAINLGRGSFLTSGLEITDEFGSVSNEPSYSVINGNDNSATNMIGAEGRYFISNNWALTLSGGIIYSTTPSSLAIPAVIDDNGTTVLPGYNAVVSDRRLDISYGIGALYFFNYKKNNRLVPYLGFLIPVNHSTRTLYDPTIESDGTIRDIGTKALEISGIGLQAIAGLDYYLTDNLYLGLSIKPLSFIAIKNSRFPGPGLFSRKVNNYSISSFVQPLISIGVKL